VGMGDRYWNAIDNRYSINTSTYLYHSSSNLPMHLQTKLLHLYYQAHACSVLQYRVISESVKSKCPTPKSSFSNYSAEYMSASCSACSTIIPREAELCSHSITGLL
jgi:hypothetical protein